MVELLTYEFLESLSHEKLSKRIKWIHYDEMQFDKKKSFFLDKENNKIYFNHFDNKFTVFIFEL